MTKIFQQPSSSQAPLQASGITHAAGSLADTELMEVGGGAEHGTCSFTFGLSFGSSALPPFSGKLLELTVGAADTHSVPWAELKPAIK